MMNAHKACPAPLDIIGLGRAEPLIHFLDNLNYGEIPLISLAFCRSADDPWASPPNLIRVLTFCLMDPSPNWPGPSYMECARQQPLGYAACTNIRTTF